MNKHYKKIYSACFLIFLTGIFYCLPGNAQVYKNSAFSNKAFRSSVLALQTVSLKLPPPISPKPLVKDAMLTMNMDLGDSYTFGNVVFKMDVVFDIQVFENGGLLKDTITFNQKLTLTNTKPEYQFRNPILKYLTADSIRVILKSITTSVTDTRLSASVQSAIKSQIASAFRVNLSYVINYGIPLNPLRPQGLLSFRKNNKVMELRWDSTGLGYAPDYQVQILKLYNRQDPFDPAVAAFKQKILSDSIVYAEVNWNEALTLHTESSDRVVRFSIAEGTGYYAWRIRPIGTFNDGGIANSLNYGPWSHTSVSGSLVKFDGSSIVNDINSKPLAVFYFQDIDENKNTIYSRTFTEGNKVSEKISYANPLQQTKQTQTFLPSKKNIVTSQTLYDYSNRASLSTLPVPTTDTIGLNGYKNKFVKANPASRKPTDTTRLYNAQDFDAKNNIRSPATINSLSTPFNYYTGQNNVADAQGFPYTRTLFYNDGTNRVREQSGVGKTHMLSNTPDATTGKTVKTYYGTASETELVRLFGDEAPSGESVLKTITVDQNNTASITYTSKEGKVIATSLAFQDQQSVLQALPSDQTDQTVKIQDSVKSNFSNSTGITGSKRVAFNERTNIGISYQTKCPDPKHNGCFDSQLNCSYDLWVYVKRLDGENFSGNLTSPFYLGFKKVGSSQSWNYLASDSTVIFAKDTGISCRALNSIIFDTLSLPPGSYLIEKQLIPKGGELFVSRSQAALGKQIQPLTDMIASWLDLVKCEKGQNGMDSFYKKLRTLKKDINTADSLCIANNLTSSCDSVKFRAYSKTLSLKYKPLGLAIPPDTAFFTREHHIYISSTGIPDFLTISSKCCGNMRVPIEYQPAFDLSQLGLKDRNNDKLITVNPYTFSDTLRTEFYPDFEGFAYGYFWNCVPSGMSLDTAISNNGFLMIDKDTLNHKYLNYKIGIKDSLLLRKLNVNNDTTLAKKKLTYIYNKILKPYLPGYEKSGTFNLMVYHMLNDVYTCDGLNAKGDSATIDSPALIPDPCGGLPTDLCNGKDAKNRKLCKQYEAHDLFNCWINQLNYVKAQSHICPDALGLDLSEGDGPPYKMSDSFDKENKNGDKHNNQFDSNAPRGLVGFFARRKIKKLSMRVRELQWDNPPPTGDGQNDPPIKVLYNLHLVNEFLNCTGYRFAKILTNVPTQSNASPLLSDTIKTMKYKVPSSHSGTWSSYNGKNRGYKPDSLWIVSVGTGLNKDTLFRYIKDPVYAFKYYEYKDNSFPEIEITTCYSDPNYYMDSLSVKHYLCPGKDSLCNFCGVGRVKCSITKDQWNCGQRFTFYQLLRTAKPSASIDWSDGLAKEDVMSIGFKDSRTINNIKTDTFFVWNPNSPLQAYAGNYQDSIASRYTALRASKFFSQVEIDINSLNLSLRQTCDDKRGEYELILRKAFIDKCYIFGECQPGAASGNIIQEKDFQQLVDAMVDECKQRGQVNSFYAVTDTCIDIHSKSLIYQHQQIRKSAYLKLDYGVKDVSGTGDSQCKVANLFWRPSFTAANTIFSPAVTLQATSSLKDSMIVIYDCSATNLPYSQWRRRKEVTEMSLSVNIPNATPPAPGCTNSNPFACDTTSTGSSYAINEAQDNQIPDAGGRTPSKKPKKSQAVELMVDINSKNKKTVKHSREY